ncbi:HNH endonuclease family protein [Edaphobacter albus]|uniref:HNH endonuclease family protein n=1 Tax=Edaphobacter sp. 4G125 TaxID=2763071 RepID=UPI0016456CCD|nr:DUF262 domain-containing protein [Edaphobacter sp. 4G125]QNI35868.1 DUF262 domain-containing protein [Edaphobacter sp. 4G125]
MAGRKLVNLDAMIPRADFALVEGGNVPAAETIANIGTRDFKPDGILPLLRKPDFQRETNHWNPAQITLLIKSFVDGDLIPSVILWRSSGSIFVIDGGHRLSVLRAWIEDDYGDRAISQTFFGFNINDNQKKAAKETRQLVEREVGTYQQWIAKGQIPDLPKEEKERTANVLTRSIPIQWVNGNAETAQASFLKINTQGTPLDDIEMLLIRNRKRPAAIAARSIIRAGMGHKYWSSFPKEKQKLIEEKSSQLYQWLFEPEVDSPIKTLDLPLGGGAGVRTALRLLVDFVMVASRDQQGDPVKVEDETEDENGDGTIFVLDRTLRLAGRITGNDNGSLGLHPAVYFYGPSGTHVGALFMGMSTLLARKLLNHDTAFFQKFSKVRKPVEEALIEHKRLIAAVIQNTRSAKRYDVIADLFMYLIDSYSKGVTPTEEDIVSKAGVEGKIILGVERQQSSRFATETKSAIYLRDALASALRCSICGGYLDPTKSVSYDHKKRVREGGVGTEDNGQLAHHYCNQSVKN